MAAAQHVTTYRFTDEDRQMLETIKDRLAIRSNTDAIRYCVNHVFVEVTGSTPGTAIPDPSPFPKPKRKVKTRE